MNHTCYCELFAIKCCCDYREHLNAADDTQLRDDHTARLAPRARRGLALGGVWDDCRPPVWVGLEAAAGVSRTRVPGGGRLHGPRQLGDLARRRVQVRLRAALDRTAVQPDGNRAAGALCPAGDRGRSRSGPGLPRCVSTRTLHSALARGRACDLRDGSRRGDWYRDRAQSAVRHSARTRRGAHCARRVHRARHATAWLPLGRGDDRGAARCDRRLFRHPDRARATSLGRGDPRFCSERGDHSQSRATLSRAGHPGRHGDAAQPLSPLGRGADAPLRQKPRRAARGRRACDRRLRPWR